MKFISVSFAGPLLGTEKKLVLRLDIRQTFSPQTPSGGSYSVSPTDHTDISRNYDKKQY